mmetsp:Transcript_81088/g.112659  ORF Transcript_81088/g.112659 Transcript_81088/m.112659 type:complete len:570 (+) Transcript_81088:305-2014(+)
MSSPPEVAFTTAPPGEQVPDAAGQELCAASGPICRKVVDFLAKRVPATFAEKLDFLCGQSALDCVSQHAENCTFFQAQVLRLQSQWSCEALACSSKGRDCQKAVELLDMDDHQLTAAEKQEKTRFLCSDAGLQCITDHKDSCMSAFEILSMAHDLRHCDRVRCTDAGPGCQRAVEYLTKDDLANLTHRKTAESHAKWDYLCSDESLTCLADNLDRCQRYHDFLKGAFGNGQCSFVECAKAGPECKRAVMYLSQTDADLSEEDQSRKHAYLCGDSSAVCLSLNEPCSPYMEMLKQMKENECVTKPIVKVTVPPDAEVLDARSDAARAAAQVVVKAHSGPSSAKEDAEQKAAKAAEEALKKEEKRMLAKATAISEGRPMEESTEKAKSQDQEGKDTKKDEKKAASLAVGGVLVCLSLAGGGFIWWRRKRARAGKFEKGVPPKPKKPGKRGKNAEGDKSADDADKPARGIVAGTMARFQRLASFTSFSPSRKPKDAKGDEATEPAAKGSDDDADASAKEKEEAKAKAPEAGADEPPLPPPSAPVFTGDQAASEKEGAPAAATSDSAEEPKEY